MTKRLGLLAILLITAVVVSCGQTDETDKLIGEMNTNRTKCQELTKQAEAKRADAKRQFDAGQRAEREKSIDEAANLYGQIAKLLNESADKADKIVTITTTDWYKEYFTAYSKWTRNLAKLAGGAREELIVRKNGTPTADQLKTWRANIAEIRKENDAFVKQIAKLESDNRMVLVAHD
ncbi:MAG TPA: hypothetical protein VGJ55_14385 [Pyrinomonadaceae bacterium]|jgi:macrodomain Ter protein organizer (MatP/YcbG family)